GNQITKNKLVNAKINPVVKTIFVPNFFSKNPITKFVDASAIKIVASLTNGNEQLTNMISTMEQDKIKYATQTICRDLLDLI
ncbi:hypothetical protein M8410_15830, partial [Staphylococcus aureus]|nr:hypothetical protein [Staphylococcus aureus]